MTHVNHLSVFRVDNGRRFAISDVHACIKTFKALLKQIRLQKSDQLFLLGDIIHRSPNNHKTLNYIIKLKKEGYQVYYIRGNHEQTVLNTIKKTEGQRKRILMDAQPSKLLKNGKLRKKYRKLLKSTYHFIELDRYFLVHAGFNDKASNPFDDTFAMLNTRDFKHKSLKLNGKRLIIGHTPTDLKRIRTRIEEKKLKICIDNGCANPKNYDQGNLVCFNIDSNELVVQKNIDKQKEETIASFLFNKFLE